MVLAALAVGGWAGVRYLTRPAVTLVAPETGPAVRAVYATGNVEAVYWARVTPLVKGRIDKILVEENQEVTPDQPLAQLDESEARAEVKELQAQAAYLKGEVERTRNLLAKGAGTTKAYEYAVSEYQKVHAAIAAAQARRDYYVLRAPLAGRVLRHDGEPGEVVDTEDVVFWIGRPRPLRITADVDEEDIPLVRIGQEVLIKADAFPGRVLPGTVAEITPKGDPVNKSYRVRVALPDDTPLLLGMTTELNIVVERHAAARLVPETAVDGNRVWVVHDGRAQPVAIEVGIRGNGKAEIVGGRLGDEPVVLHPPVDLKAGARVRVAPPEGP